ncbi:MAG: TSCPD domain-containing protein [Planctomycetota bacterium]|jgi:hypothetical protein
MKVMNEGPKARRDTGAPKATNGAASAVTSESVESDAKERAATVVQAWRRLDWQGVEAGGAGALEALADVIEDHESTRRFLVAEAGEVGTQLEAGLARFYAREIAPLITPTVCSRLAAQAAGEPDAPVDDGLAPKKRPSITIGHTVRMNTGCGNLYVTINESDDGQPFELFNHMGKAGGCAASQNEAIGRLISYALRCGASVEPLVKQLKGISCHRPAWGEDGKISSCSDAIGKALEKYYVAKAARFGEPTAAAGTDAAVADATSRMSEARDHDLAPGADLRQRMAMTQGSGGGRKTPDITRVQGACPDCGSQLSFEEGCVKCHSCGFTECG